MISVVITTKDRIDFLKRAVQSIIENTRQPNEIIIINDGGVKINNELFTIPDNITLKVFNHSTSLGGNIARNRGVKESSGSVIYFLDDDDALSMTSIESRYEIFSNKNIGLVYTGKKFVYDDTLDRVFRSSLPTFSGDCFKDLLKYGNIIGSTSCVAVRRDVFYEAGLFDEQLGALQDYDLWIRISKICNVGHDSSEGLIYTIHKSSDQISAKFDKYLVAGKYLSNKYVDELNRLRLYNTFVSARYLRVAISASKVSVFNRVKYSLLSFVNKPSLKAIFLMLPIIITKHIKVLS